MAPNISYTDIPSNVRKICQILENEGYEAWVVGGWVRDFVLGRTPKDCDIATNAMPGVATEIFQKAGCRVEPTGIEHGTITVIEHGYFPVEVTTFRGDGEYTDGRRPDSVHFVKTIQEDLARRDFTINAMAFRPVVNAFEGPARGEFVDPFGGMSDIRDNRIKTVGDAQERFMEDGLRVMRALRFCSQLGFFIAKDTKEAMFQTPVKRKCLGVAVERQEAEIRKMMSGRHVAAALYEMDTCGLLYPFFSIEKVEPTFFKEIECIVAPDDTDTFVARMAALLHTMGPDTANLVLNALRLPTADKMDIVSIIRAFYHAPVSPNGDPVSARKWLSDIGPHRAVPAIMVLRQFGNWRFADIAYGEFDKGPPLSVSDLAVSGEEVCEVLDIKPGRQVGEALRFLLSKVIEEPSLNKMHILTKLLMREFGSQR